MFFRVLLILFLFFANIIHTEAATLPFCSIKNTLSFGAQGAEVRLLQQFLNTDSRTQVAESSYGSPGHETTYFGQATRRAVNTFQELHASEVLAPLLLSSPTGLVGPLTRATIARVCAERAEPSSNITTAPKNDSASILPSEPDSPPIPFGFRLFVLTSSPGFGAGGGKPLSVTFDSAITNTEGTAVDLSSLSAVDGNSPYTYAWDFGDGNTSTDTAPIYTYADNGTYTITVTVTDSRNESVTKTATVTTTNTAPSASITGSYTTTTGTNVSFTKTVTDPSSADTTAGFTYTWDFGDNTTSTSDSPSKTYYVPGAYTVTLTVTDKDGATATTTTTATISGDALIIPGPGWSGATAQPETQGAVDDFGYNNNTIARWNVVPHQTFSDTFRVGILAFHNSGIDNVAFAVNGGAWTSIPSKSTNPRTNVTEYWATVRASDFADGQIELRAIAYPNTGVPRVLPSLFLNANATNTLPNTVRYVSNSGNDTTGDGSAGNPFQTISKAIFSIRAAQSSDVGGGTVYLQAGSYAYGAATENFTQNAATQWLTISAVPGTAKEDVFITSYGSTNGVRAQKVHLKNLTVSGVTSLPTNGSIGAKGWLDNVTYIGPGKTVANSQPFASAAVWTGGMYFTDVNISQSANGTVAAALVRNVTVHDISSDAFQSALLVIESSAENIDPTGTAFHADIYQANGSANNVILSNVTGTNTIVAQGLFSDSTSTITDMAVVESAFNNQDPTPNVGYVFQLGAATNNLYILDSTFTGPTAWRTDQNFVATDVVIENTTFSNSPGPLEGVTYR